MRATTAQRFLAIIAALSLSGAACGGGDGDEQGADGRTGGKIAYWGDHGVFTMDADGSHEARVTTFVVEEYGGYGAVSWSPDGERIAFTLVSSGYHPDTGGYEVWVVNADGTDERKLADGGEPAWSPDGERIVYSEVGYFRVWVMNADGSDKRRLAHGRDPTWSPDGDQIAIDDGNGVITIIDVATGGGPGTAIADGYDPAWSPDGDRIAFTRESSGSGADEIWVMGVDGSGLQQLTHPVEGSNEDLSMSIEVTNESPAWSADGERIIWERSDELWTMKADGSEQKRLAEGAGPSWSDPTG